jgi:phosphatidyl-myo-inositol dimannoside synthase
MSDRRPLRILYVSHSFPLPGEPLSNVGGMQRVAVALHEALARHPGVELRSRLLETSWRQTGPRMVPFLARMLRDLPAQVRRERIDVVLFSSMVTASAVLLLRERIRKAGAVTAAIPVGRDVTLPNPLYQRLVPRVLSSLDRVLPISRATADECLGRGLDPARLEIIPCGVDLERFSPAPAGDPHRGALLDRLGIDHDDRAPFLLFSVGRHQERKGFHWFVERVMPLLPEETVFLLGGEGPMTGRIREAARVQGIDERVHLLGRVDEDELLALYRAADLFVMPNIPVAGDIEGFGVVMLEAGASGLPVIAADLEGIRDVVTQDENGVLVPSGDAPAFAEAILRFQADRAQLRAASQRAATHTAERFGWDAVADRHVEILRGATDICRDRATSTGADRSGAPAGRGGPSLP